MAPAERQLLARIEQGQLAAYDPQTRKAAIRRKTRGYTSRLTSLMVKIARKSLGKN